MPAADTKRAREFFPRGLTQPESGFRFSMDALLLASFAGPGKARNAVDLGTGCGVIGLGLLLRTRGRDLRVTGLDASTEMLGCATANAGSLGFEQRFSTLQADVQTVRGHEGLPAESFDLVVCNPPYRQPGSGRRPQDQGRDQARFEALAPVSEFVGAAAYLLQNRHRACFIGLAERLPELLADMGAHRLEPKRLRLVHSRLGEPARLALVEAVKNAGSGLVAEAPLILYAGHGDDTRLTQDALGFCPFLACNA